MVTDTAYLNDCSNGCSAKSLASYVQENGATYGIHGSYFCPPDYADCAGRTNSFNSPVFNSAGDIMINADSLPYHAGPMIAVGADGQYSYFHRTIDFGYSVAEFEAEHGTQSGGYCQFPLSGGK